MSASADLTAGDDPRPAQVAAHPDTLRALTTLVRRELWEHRALWIAPILVALLVAVSAFLARIDVDLDHAMGKWGPEQARQAITLFSQWALAMPLFAVAGIVVPFYLLDCLYAERKDRSILFWKSLPVSDTLTVLSKALVALVIVPLGVFVLAGLAYLVATVIWNVRVQFGFAPAHLVVWDTLLWFKLETVILRILLLTVLWAAPLAAYLMLVSAWARRSPFIWALMPVVLAPLFERIVFGTKYLWHLLLYRFAGIFWSLGQDTARELRHARIDSPVEFIDRLNFTAAFTNVDLWIGVAVAALLLLAAIRLRRYRDDT
jgi:ABC-2 type transport system permease protein